MLAKPPALKSKKKLLSIGLRGKLLIATLTLLLLPIASYFYLLELENYLKTTQLNSQLENSVLMASFFDASEELNWVNQLHNEETAIYVYPLSTMPLVDGYFDDWKRMYLQEQHFPSNEQNQNDAVKFSLLSGLYNQNLYFFIKVNDSSLRYKLPENRNKFDYIRLSFTGGSSAELHHYDLASEAPGWFVAESDLSANTFSAHNIKGEWQENRDGYQLEFSIPMRLLGNYLSLTVYDDGVPYASYNIGIAETGSLNPIIKESPNLNRQLSQLAEKLSDAKSRLYIINRQAEVLAHTGELKPSTLLFREPNSFITHINNLYQALMGLEIKNRRYFGQLSHLSGEEIEQALGKSSNPAKPAAAWLAGSNSQTLILSTAAPIVDEEGRVMGALVLEKTNASILALHDQTFEKILLITLLLFFSIAVILLIYSGRLVNRILNLQKATELALTQEGKFQPVFPSSNSWDEIGQLSRSFTVLMQRLDQYTNYLETLASKLSHELRTPLSIIKSSLENMQFQGIDEKNQKFMQRAQDGTERLSLILSRMGEASRLEQTIQGIEKETVELNAFVSQYMEAIQVANPQIDFEVKVSQSVKLSIAPDLMAQLLDKLIDNAISYHKPGSTIVIALASQGKQRVLVDVFNIGPWIDPQHLTTIFDSMISYRQKLQDGNGKKSLNLGLGLHIAKLISDYHQAKLECINRRADGINWKENGVSFVLEFQLH